MTTKPKTAAFAGRTLTAGLLAGTMLHVGGGGGGGAAKKSSGAKEKK